MRRGKAVGRNLGICTVLADGEAEYVDLPDYIIVKYQVSVQPHLMLKLVSKNINPTSDKIIFHQDQ